MFAPLIAKAQTKPAGASTHTGVYRRPTLSAQRLGHGGHEQASGPRRTAGDQAMRPRGFDFSRIPIHPPARGAAQRAAGDQVGEEGGIALAGNPETSTLNVPAANAGALGGDAKSISTGNLHAPEWKDYGEFKWWIKWVTDGTSGWIVQKITNTYSGSLANGTEITNATVGAEPTYYEAWEVAANGTITGSLGATGNRDRWERPRMPNGSKGSFSITGNVYWTSQDPQKSGFKSGGVANAGSLLSSKTAPAGLSASLLDRAAYGTWVSTGAPALPGCFTT
jgi:hypothetical protein